MKVRILQPAKTAMQSGRGKSKSWVIQPVNDTRKTPEPVMGWVSAGDTNDEIKLSFDSLDAAISFAEGKDWDYTVQPSHGRTIKPKAYADNFAFNKVR